MRFGAEDFGYTFVATDDAEAGDDDAAEKARASISTAVSATTDDPANKTIEKDSDISPLRRRSSRAGDESTKPYIYAPPPKKYGGLNLSGGSAGSGGKHPMDDDDDDSGGGSPLAMSTGMGACCCCLCAVLVIAGGVMLVYQRLVPTDEGKSGDLAFAGSVVLVIAAGTFLCGFCACCFSLVAACASGGGDGDLAGLLGSSSEDEDPSDVKVKFKRLNDSFDRAEEVLNTVHLNVIGDMKEVKEAQKKEEENRKEKEKENREELEARVKKDLESGLTTDLMRRNYRPIAFFVRFDGDMMLNHTLDVLRKQVSIIVNCGRAGVDRAVVLVTSPGGAVSPYGLASSQLVRIRKAGIHLVVCVDTVAASGGYMMASVGDVINAAPFAMLGSIGVLTQIPNFQRFLNKHDIDAYLFTAGKHKRTVDLIGDVTEEGKAKLKEELNEIHRVFKDHVALARPALQETIEDVATGEVWLGVQAKERGLVDAIMTSDEYLESIYREYEIIEIVEKRKKKGAFSAFKAVARTVKGMVEGAAPVNGQGRHMAAMP